ncbi:hypothetical protein CN918_27160 [Priestia megaterium]|nr:hypothetical protein CN918_27160 [Priestia megaterium]
MLHIITGLLSSLMAIGIYSFFHRQTKTAPRYLFYLLAIGGLGGYVLHLTEHFGLWIAFFIFLYVCIDDIHHTSISIFPPVALSLCFYFFNGNPYSLLWAAGYFVLFLLLDLLWTKCISENFDVLFLFPFLYLPFFDRNEWLSFLIFLTITCLALLSKNRVIGEGDAYYTFPLLLLLPPSAFIPFLLFACILALPFAYYQAYFKDKDEFAYTPYLIGGFLLTYSSLGTFPLYILVGAFLSVFLMRIRLQIKKVDPN